MVTTIEQWRKFFPRPQAREGQIQAINDIIDFFESNLFTQQIYLLDAPTGIGKSAIGITVANYFADKYGFGTNYLTHHKSLETQIIQDYNGISHTLGRSNFKCRYNGNSCEQGKCQNKVIDKNTGEVFKCAYSPKKSQNQEDHQYFETKTELLSIKFSPDQLNEYYKNYIPNYTFLNQKQCEYWDLKVKATKSLISLHNYYYFHLENKHIGDFRKRFLLICDEGHKIEDIIMGFISFNITDRQIEELGLPLKIEEYSTTEWCKKVKECMEYLQSPKLLQYTKNIIKQRFGVFDSENVMEGIKTAMDREQDRMLNSADKLVESLDNIRFVNEKDWVVDYRKEGMSTYREVMFKPIEVAPYIYDNLLYAGMKVLIMSATLFPEKQFIRNFGLELIDGEGNVRFQSLGCPFPLKNRPVFFIPVVAMNYKGEEECISAMIPTIKAIMEQHKGQKGLIHTKSYRLSYLIEEKLQDPRILIHTNKNRQETIDKFINEKDNPTVLVSPSIEEGLDLYDERCRFIIISKVPYLNLGDKQIKKRMEKDTDWYNWKAVQTIIQEAGRGVRHMTDWCDTYILDSNFQRVLTSYDHLIPQWFKDAIQRIENYDEYLALHDL